MTSLLARFVTSVFVDFGEFEWTQQLAQKLAFNAIVLARFISPLPFAWEEGGPHVRHGNEPALHRDTRPEFLTQAGVSDGDASKEKTPLHERVGEPIWSLLNQRCGRCHSGGPRLASDFDLADRASLAANGWISTADPSNWKLLKYLELNPHHASRSRLVTRDEVEKVLLINPNGTKRTSSLMQIALTETRCSRFVRWAQQSGVYLELSGSGPYTIFAPTNEAIARLPPDLLRYLEQPENRRSVLKDVLVNHGVADKLLSADLAKRASVDSILEVKHSLPVIDEKQYVGNAVVQEQIIASNGVVHLIDRVLLPPGVIYKANLERPSEGVGVVVAGGIYLVEVPGGTVRLGEPGKDREFHLSSFYMSKYETTDDAFTSLMQRKLNMKLPARRQEHKALPAEHVSWYAAAEFCNRLSAVEGFPPYYRIDQEGEHPVVSIPDRKGIGFRLPTEAEWEHACRGGKTGQYYFGADPKDLGDHAVFDLNSYDDAEMAWLAKNVGSQEDVHPFGLFDMYGNVAEWCFDWHVEDAQLPRTDERYLLQAQPPMPYAKKVIRGGSYLTKAAHIGSGKRGRPRLPYGEYPNIGFRVVRNVDQTKSGASFKQDD